ncbi:hypothetical protein [Microbacterium binotii]|uniref:hypothetical protein n=1 Tax=Microbacterium binotii TaxID=462710 RepID=UPI001F402E1F|nr:hypothetical protein [Microbacterium binotii]UIN31892.1 hypothetical protein LXM64_06815 [Microbacterium binotii]
MDKHPAPKPSNFADMVDAWDDPHRFAELCRDYYDSLRTEQPIDFTIPRRTPGHSERTDAEEATL